MNGIFQADISSRGLVFDPRTKLLLMITICIFVIGSVGSGQMTWLPRILGLIPILLLYTARQWKKATQYAVVYCLLEAIQIFLFPSIHGVWQSICTLIFLLILRLMPCIIMGAYLLATTTVSEFTAAMERIHIPNVITISMSVMFRLFPTILEEFRSINTAMKMRDIRIGGKMPGKIVEYRIVPLIICSVNIGNELSAAALARGLGSKTKRTNICEIGFHVQDILLLAFAIFLYVLLIMTKLGW